MAGEMHPAVPPLRLIAWEVTRCCVLACRHCRAAATQQGYDGEFSTAECERFLDSVAAMGPVVIILTGGEPLRRPDILHIARYGTDRGLRMVMATCGTLLDTARCEALLRAGIARISVSMDGASAQSHDTFRGVPGAYEGLLRGIEAARAAGLPFQVNTTVTRSNVAELPNIYAAAEALGAVSFHPFLLVPTGRAAALTDEVIEPAEYERVLSWIYELQQRSSLTIKPTCAPQFYRIAATRGHKRTGSAAHNGHGLDTMSKGCLGGQGFAFVSHVGTVQICGFLDVAAGDVRQSNFDFDRIWRQSPLFAQVRDVRRYHGTCGVCEYGAVCGGCRARAYADTGDYLGDEPQCTWVPQNMKRGMHV